MCVPGGPRVVLDSEPRAPAPPTVPPPARPPRRGPRSGWRRVSLRRGNLTVKNNSRPASLSGRHGWRWPTPSRPHLRGSFVVFRHERCRHTDEGSRPVTSLAHRGFVHLGMDVAKDSISVAILQPDRDVAVTDKISSDAESVRRLIKRVGRPSGIWACYEAGPTGYDLYRLLGSMNVRCDVVAPSLIPKGGGTGSRPTSVTLGGWPACTGPASHPDRRAHPCPGGGPRSVPHPRRHGRGSHPGP